MEYVTCYVWVLAHVFRLFFLHTRFLSSYFSHAIWCTEMVNFLVLIFTFPNETRNSFHCGLEQVFYFSFSPFRVDEFKTNICNLKQK